MVSWGLLATTGLSVLLWIVYCFWKSFAVKIINLHLLVKYGMAETAQRFTDGGHGVVKASFLRYGRVYFINGWFEAQKVFGSSAFHARLGDIEGLRLLGMDGMGIIWNNDDPKWRIQRKIFTEAVQDRRDTKRREVARLCHDAVQLTLQEARNGGVATNRDDNVVQMNGLNLLRCITCRVTLALAFGLQLGSVSYIESMGLVRKVNAFFKAWEFFLLRPWWYLWVFRRREALQHRKSVLRLGRAVEDVLIQAAAGGGCGFGGVTTATAAAKIATGTGAATTTAPFLKSIFEHLADGRLSRAEAVQLSLEMIIAGTDTSSVTLFYSLLAIRDDQELQRELWSELRQKTEGPCYELRDLRLLQAVLSESMRYKPVGPVVIRQATKDLSLERLPVQGRGAGEGEEQGLQQQRQRRLPHRLRKGDTVVVNLAHMHRDPTIFPYPNNFDVRNFLDPPPPPSIVYGSSGEPMPTRDVTTGPGTRRSFLPFGDGQKGCVGKLLAMDEMTAIMWSLARSLELPALPSPRTPSQPPPRQRKAALLAPRLADLETKWEVANQPKEEMLIDIRFTSTSSPPMGPSTPERLPAPLQRAFPVSALDGGLPMAPPPPLVAPPDADTDTDATIDVVVGADPLPKAGNTNITGITPLPPLMDWSRQRRLQYTTSAAVPAPPGCWRRVMVYLTGPGGVGKTTVLRDVETSLLAGLGCTTRTEEARELLKILGIGQSQLEDDAAVFLKFQKELVKQHYRRDAPAIRRLVTTGVEDDAAEAVAVTAAAMGAVASAKAALSPAEDATVAMGAGAKVELPEERAAAEADAVADAEVAEVEEGDSALLLCDRSAIDALCYTAFRFGIDSPEVEEVLGMTEMKHLLELYGARRVPTSMSLPASTDAHLPPAPLPTPEKARTTNPADANPSISVRIPPSGVASAVSIHCLHVLVPPFQPSLEQYDAKDGQQQRHDQWGQQKNGVMDDDGTTGTEVADGKQAGGTAAIAVEDDGVRLRVSLDQLEKHTAIAAMLLQRLQVPHLVLQERGQEARCRELHQILEDYFNILYI
ncbi:hypothetical protein VaNZ11_002162 [Volvox africanus]|uniref:Cytochrome P450 n=1 Tax=Volvox africanus TaxID=51714 RepID=A0ABQ5RS08_9CHLO|nr:hypothetical protein VaNZ11_002162 [Volvox africanus]